MLNPLDIREISNFLIRLPPGLPFARVNPIDANGNVKCIGSDFFQQRRLHRNSLTDHGN